MCTFQQNGCHGFTMRWLSRPKFYISRNIFGKRSDLPFSRKSDHKKQKRVVSFTHEQNSICSQKQLNDIAHEHTIICKQLFAGHVVGCRPMKRKKHLHRMIISFIPFLTSNYSAFLEFSLVHSISKLP